MGYVGEKQGYSQFSWLSRLFDDGASSVGLQPLTKNGPFVTITRSSDLLIQPVGVDRPKKLPYGGFTSLSVGGAESKPTLSCMTSARGQQYVLSVPQTGVAIERSARMRINNPALWGCQVV